MIENLEEQIRLFWEVANEILEAQRALNVLKNSRIRPIYKETALEVESKITAAIKQERYFMTDPFHSMDSAGPSLYRFLRNAAQKGYQNTQQANTHEDK